MGGGQTVVYRDGQKLTPLMAYWFDLMARDFLKDTGCTLHVSSGLRYTWEQEAIFRSRYVPSAVVNGRRVYDWRWWNGALWGRISPAGTVAVPRTSNHEFEVTGVGAIDVYDTGRGPGVTTRGSTRSNWMRDNAWKYHYDNEGFNFAEAWHKRFLAQLWGAVPASTNSRPLAPPAEPPPPMPLPIPKEDEMAIKFGHRSTGVDEWMILHPDFHEPGKPAGRIVTTSSEEAIAMARLYKNGWATTLVGEGNVRYDFDVARDQYIEIQKLGERAHVAAHPECLECAKANAG